jgi:hypothetical protein
VDLEAVMECLLDEIRRYLAGAGKRDKASACHKDVKKTLGIETF